MPDAYVDTHWAFSLGTALWLLRTKAMVMTSPSCGTSSWSCCGPGPCRILCLVGRRWGGRCAVPGQGNTGFRTAIACWERRVLPPNSMTLPLWNSSANGEAEALAAPAVRARKHSVLMSKRHLQGKSPGPNAACGR